MAAVNFKRYGGEHNRPGADGGCFLSALKSVLIYGGVLEHPANSKAWAQYRLPPPVGLGWRYCARTGTWACEVWQSAYGHRARKRTWLLYASPRSVPPAELDWTRAPGTHQIGWFDRSKPTLGKREASATPVDFARALVALARGAAPC